MKNWSIKGRKSWGANEKLKYMWHFKLGNYNLECEGFIHHFGSIDLHLNFVCIGWNKPKHTRITFKKSFHLPQHDFTISISFYLNKSLSPAVTPSSFISKENPSNFISLSPSQYLSNFLWRNSFSAEQVQNIEKCILFQTTVLWIYWLSGRTGRGKI